MNFKQAVADFEETWLPLIIERYSASDEVAIRTGFNDYIDGLHKDGLITEHQAYNWPNPYN